MSIKPCNICKSTFPYHLLSQYIPLYWLDTDFISFEWDFTQTSMPFFNPSIWGGGQGSLPPGSFLRELKTVGTRLLKLCDFYC